METTTIREPRVKVGDIVQCPADRGSGPYRGRVTFVESPPATHLGRVFYWVHVKDIEGAWGHTSVWPDHRLGK